jgi:hypothetical protein
MHTERATRLQRLNFEYAVELERKLFEKTKDGLFGIGVKNQYQRDGVERSLSGHTMVKFDPRVHAMCRNDRFGGFRKS